MKKVKANIYKFLTNIDSNTSKNINNEVAFQKISEWGNIEIEVNIHVDNTEIDIYKDSTKVDALTIDGYMIDAKTRDIDWDRIYNDVMVFIIKNKLVTKVKGSKLPKKYVQAQKAEAKARKKQEKEAVAVAKKKKAEPQMSIEELKKLKKKLYYKIYNQKGKGRDLSELQKQYDEVMTQYNKLK